MFNHSKRYWYLCRLKKMKKEEGIYNKVPQFTFIEF